MNRSLHCSQTASPVVAGSPRWHPAGEGSVGGKAWLSGVGLVGPIFGLLVMFAAEAAAEVMLFRGERIYVVPARLSDRLIELASRDSWQHFEAHTRDIDEDGDGVIDYRAIALGADGGYGAQVRYRMEKNERTDEVELGRWYWAVVTDSDGKVLYEVFNP